jgi:hypothetical protein
MRGYQIPQIASNTQKDKTEIVVYNFRGFNFIKKNKMFKQNQLKSIKLSG